MESNLDRTTRPHDNKKKKEKEPERDNYQDFARELEKQWNIKVSVIRIVIGSFGSVTRVFVQGLQ